MSIYDCFYLETMWEIVGGETSKEGVEKILRDHGFLFEMKEKENQTWFKIPVEGGDVMIKQMKEVVKISFEEDKPEAGWKLII